MLMPNPSEFQSPAQARHRQARFSDRGASPAARMLGLGGAVAVALLMLVVGLNWRSYVSAPPQARVTTFAVSVPADPAAAVQDIPPAADKVDAARVPPPPAILPSSPAQLPVIALKASQATVPAASPAIRVSADPSPVAAIESRPASPPSLPQASGARRTWEGLVLGALDKVKRYPREARITHRQGAPFIRFVIDREGRVITTGLERSSGHPSLDREALALPRRAAPFPRPPEDVRGEAIELVVPVEFFFR